MKEFATMTEAIHQGYRAHSYNDNGIIVRKETKHGVFMRALVRYAPTS